MTASETFAGLRERASELARARLEASFQGNDKYHAGQMQTIAEQVPAELAEDLEKLSGNFKFVVTCQIVPKAQAGRYGIHASSSCVFDAAKDGACTVQWENSAVFCLVNIFGLHLQ